MRITLPVSSLSGPHHILPQTPNFLFFLHTISPPAFSILLTPFPPPRYLCLPYSVSSRSVFPWCTWPCSFALAFSLPSFLFSLISLCFVLHLSALPFPNSLPLPLLLALAFFFSSQLPRSLSTLGNVPAPLPWRWTNFPPPLLFHASSSNHPPFLYPPCLWFMAPLFGKERKIKMKKELQSTKTYTESHKVTHPYIPSMVLTKCSSLHIEATTNSCAHSSLGKRAHRKIHPNRAGMTTHTAQAPSQHETDGRMNTSSDTWTHKDANSTSSSA